MGDSPKGTEAAAGTGSGDCPLELRLQIRNCRIYAAQISLTYLAAPALYVGFVQAGLCKRLHTSDVVANLPSTVFLGMAWVPLVVTWLYPAARQFKMMMGLSYSLSALMGIALAATLLAQPSGGLIVAALVVHAGVLGAANGVINIMGWEALNRGVSARLRGKALGLAFGWGPAFAVVGSLGAQLLLEGKVFGWTPPSWLGVPYPRNYALLFAMSAACTGLAAFLVRLYRIPVPSVDVQRESFSTAIVGGFKAFLRYRVLLIASLAYLLMYCGNLVQTNMSLFTYEAVGRMSEDLVGYELTLRFFFKILAGFFLGWLLTKTNPKASLLVTAGLQIAGVLWVLFVPGYWFLLAFGINGAGELFGVYYMNYPVQCSPTSQVRRNIAFLTLLSSLVGFAPVMYGWISDTWSLRTSFWVALAILVFTTVMVIVKLPSHPRPRPEDLTDADRAQPA
ncbi:MAG: transporter, major facilitator family [Verrucomicrobia bacterium]|nr:transporter, major facilitator family [Verrucomicrobiota bacterium]